MLQNLVSAIYFDINDWKTKSPNSRNAKRVYVFNKGIRQVSTERTNVAFAAFHLDKTKYLSPLVNEKEKTDCWFYQAKGKMKNFANLLDLRKKVVGGSRVYIR